MSKELREYKERIDNLHDSTSNSIIDIYMKRELAN